jgi:hypothetical protein
LCLYLGVDSKMLYYETEGAPCKSKGLLVTNGELALRIRGDDMAKSRKSRKRCNGKIIPARFDFLAAALYWTVRLILLIWDWLTR